MSKFKIICTICGNEHASIWNWHNDEDSGYKIKCGKCGHTEKY